MFHKTFLFGGLIALSTLTANAATLQVAPVLLDVATAGDAATSITLRNPSNAPLNAQVRIYKWSQVDGRDVLDETRDVAASPPAVRMKPNSNYTVRIVRLMRKPVVGEESYRLLVDEIPDERLLKSGAVNLVVRQSIPVFFRAPDAAPASVVWTASKTNGRLSIHARNSGERRVRLSRLRVSDRSGSSVNFGDGLVGYVLGRSSMTWTSRATVKGFSGKAGEIKAQTDSGSLDASIRLN